MFNSNHCLVMNMGSAKKNETPEEREIRLKKKREQESKRRSRPEVDAHIKEYKARYNTVNQDRIKVHRAEYRAANRDKIKIKDAAYQVNNRDRLIEYRRKNVDVISERNARMHHRAKMELIRIYSNETFRCAKCDEHRIGALTIEHENGDGGGRRRSDGGPHRVFLLLRKQGFPQGIKILCSNCNWKAHLARTGPTLSIAHAAVSRRAYYRRLKEQFMQQLGGKCTVCNAVDIDILTVHHINGDGAAHRLAVANNKGGVHFYAQILKIGDLTGLECRCFSCNDEEEWRRE